MGAVRVISSVSGMSRPQLPLEVTPEVIDDLRENRAFIPAPADGIPSETLVDLVLITDDDLELTVPAIARHAGDDGVGLELQVDTLDARTKAHLQGLTRERPARAGGADRLAALRGLSAARQLEIARTGDMDQRVALERIYGKGVWDALLSNPRITVNEVARIARKGTVPKILLDSIADNAAWARTPPVRRALLGNRRLSADAVAKILRLTPMAELKLIPKQTAYPLAVRDAAQKLLKRGG